MRQTIKNRRKRGGTIKLKIRELFGIFSRGKSKQKVPTPSPKEHAHSPKEHAPSPKEHAPSPKEHAPSPKEHAPSPKEHAPSEKIEIEDVNRIIKKVLHEEEEIKISKPVREYLLQLINTKSVAEIKRIDKIEDDNIMGFGFSVSDSNKDILLSILEEIITLSINSTRDQRRKMVNAKIINSTLNRDTNKYIKRLVE